MKTYQIPSFFHDVFGEYQSAGSLLSIFLFGGGLTAALFIGYPEMTISLPLWRSALAFLLIFDIFAGCIANFTSSTSNFYAARKTNRVIFLAIHVHILLVALLLQFELAYVIGIWLYTIAGAVIVNALIGKPSQRFVGGLLMCVGLGIMPTLPDLPAYMLVICMLFMVKVLYSFAVDHYSKAAPEGGGTSR